MTAKGAIRRPLTAAAFRRWLETRRSNMRFIPRDCKQCPIARYLGNSRGNINVSVNAASITTADGMRTTPAWAELFINAFDKAHSLGERASPKDALKILLKASNRTV